MSRVFILSSVVTQDHQQYEELTIVFLLHFYCEILGSQEKKETFVFISS